MIKNRVIDAYIPAIGNTELKIQEACDSDRRCRTSLSLILVLLGTNRARLH